MIWLEASDGTLVHLSAVETISVCGQELIARLRSGETRRLLKAEHGVVEAVRQRLIETIPDPVVPVVALQPLHPVLRPPPDHEDGGLRAD